MSSLGARIKQARKDAKQTQEQVAEALGLTKGAISQWENNGTTPELAQFRSFCSVVNASADEILLGKKLRGLEKRIGALPEALREYVIQALEFAEEIKAMIPTRFLVTPTKSTYQAFHQNLVELAQSVRSK